MKIRLHKYFTLFCKINKKTGQQGAEPVIVIRQNKICQLIRVRGVNLRD